MKKILSSLAVFMLFIGSLLNAQTTTFNFSGTEWPVSAGYSTNTVQNNLGFIANTGASANLVGAVEGNTSTFSDGAMFTQRLKLNGGSYVSGTTDFSQPTQRSLFVNVLGNSTIKIWYKNGGSGTRTVYVTNGSAVITSFPYTDSTVGQIVTVNYTGPATKIFIAGDQSINFYQITATNVGVTQTLATSESVKSATKVFSSGNQVYLSKVEGNSSVEVYSTSGALVKSLNTKSDTSFTLNNKGIYIVTVKSEKGSVSQKVLIK